jgi:hypothetical protein
MSYSVRVYTGLSSNYNVFDINSIQNLITMINRKKYKLLYNSDIMVENNIIINDYIYDNMDMVMIKITTITDILTELINSHSEYFETKMNKIFVNYSNCSGTSIHLDKLVEKKFNIKFEKDNKLIRYITIYINSLYYLDISSVIICYDDKSYEKHIIKCLLYKDVNIKSWNVPEIIKLFDIIFDDYNIYISR